MQRKTFVIPEEYKNPESAMVAVKILENYFDNPEKLITYGELSERVNCAGYETDARHIERLLGEISFACKENGLPPLSGLVVNKENMCPGAGFFEAYYPNVKVQDRIVKYAEIMKQILAYPHWDEVLEAYKALA